MKTLTNKQVLEVKKNLLEFLVLNCKEHPERLYDYSLKLLEELRMQAIKKEEFLNYECQLSIEK